MKLSNLVAAAADDASEACREHASVVLWAVAQLHARQQLQAPPQGSPLSDSSFQQLCLLAADSSPTVRRRACVLLAALPRVSPAQIDRGLNKRAGVPAAARNHRPQGGDASGGDEHEEEEMELNLIVEAQTADAAQALAEAAEAQLGSAVRVGMGVV